MNWRNVQHSDPLLGETLDDRFRIEGLLGEGGMGRVYEGRQLSVDRQVAIKIIRKGIADSGIRERFMREAQVLSGLSHPNLVRLIDFGIQNERPYLVMEKVGGIGLNELLGRGRIRTALALEVVKQMGAGLAAAHAAGVVHRDLKPENIHLVASPDGTLRIKILDFGIAFPTDSEERLTKTGQVNGTPRYMAPEQARSGTVDYQADLYSVGVILYEMLTGTPPFEAESTLRVMMKHVRETPPPITEKIPANALPNGLHELVDELLAKMPRNRPQSARAVRKRAQELERREDLEQIEVGEGISIEDVTDRWVLGPDEIDPTSVGAARNRSRRHLLIGSGAALAVFALILASYIGYRELGGDSTPSTQQAESSSPTEAAAARSQPDDPPTRKNAAAGAPSESNPPAAASDPPSENSESESIFEWPPEPSEESPTEQNPGTPTDEAGTKGTSPPSTPEDESTESVESSVSNDQEPIPSEPEQTDDESAPSEPERTEDESAPPESTSAPGDERAPLDPVAPSESAPDDENASASDGDSLMEMN